MCHMSSFSPLNAQLNPICHLLALLGAHNILHVSRIRVKDEATSGSDRQLTQLHRCENPHTSHSMHVMGKVPNYRGTNSYLVRSHLTV